MRFDQTSLEDVWLLQSEPYIDHRGFFARTFCVQELGDRGLETSYLQHATSGSVGKGTLRGMHFQAEPHSEVKIVTCLKGAIRDVIIDLRPASATYRKWEAFELNAENRLRLYIPKGFAHGFQTLTDYAEVGYLISAFYEPNAARGVRFDDPAFGIEWPLPVAAISEKDASWPDFLLDEKVNIRPLASYVLLEGER